jgi:hypothetical protein
MDSRIETRANVTRGERKKKQTDPLLQAIADLKAEARKNGLTDQDIDDELAAYNAENRGHPVGP